MGADAIDLLEGEPYESPMLPFGGIEQFAWSTDGKSVAYTCRKKVGTEYSKSTDSDIYLYNIESDKTINLCKLDGAEDKNMGYDINPKFSSDGRYIAWQSMERDGYESDNGPCLTALTAMWIISYGLRTRTTSFSYVRGRDVCRCSLLI